MKKLLIPPVAKAAAKDTAPSHLPRNRHTPPLPFPHRQACVFAFPCNTCLFCVCVLFNYSRKRIYIYIFFLYVHLLLLYPNSGQQHIARSGVTWGIVGFSFTLSVRLPYFCRLQAGNWKMGHRKPGLLHLSQFVIAALVLFF